jgi:hypothetical protein
MGKSKGGIAKGRKGQCPEAYQRMNFLYQASVLMTRTYAEEKKTLRKQEGSGTEGEKNEQVDSLVALGRFYTNVMKSLGRKQVLRM